MIKTKNYNNVPDTLLPKLKPGEVAVFEGFPRNGNHYNVPHLDYVTLSDGNQYAIACVQSVSPDGNPSFFHPIFEEKRKHLIALSGNNALDVSVFQYLSLCNFNQDNKNRSTDSPVMFRIVDEGEEARVRMDKRKMLTTAIQTMGKMSDSDIEDIAARNGQDLSDPDVLRDWVENFAVSKPADFMRQVSDPTLKTYTAARKAFQAGILVFDREAYTIVLASSGSILTTVPRSTGNRYVEEFVSWLEGNEAGTGIYSEIVSQLNAGKPAKQKSAAPVKEEPAAPVKEEPAATNEATEKVKGSKGPKASPTQ